MGNGRTKQGHNAITKYLIDRSFKAVHRSHHDMNRRVEELLSLFRVEVSNQLGRIFNVGKQNGDDLAFAFQGTAGG